MAKLIAAMTPTKTSLRRHKQIAQIIPFKKAHIHYFEKNLLSEKLVDYFYRANATRYIDSDINLGSSFFLNFSSYFLFFSFSLCFWLLAQGLVLRSPETGGAWIFVV